MQQCLRAADGRRVGYALLQRLATDRKRIGDRLLAFCRVHDESDLAVLDQVDDMRTAFEHLVDALADDTVHFEKRMRATGRDNPETAPDEISRHVEQAFLVRVTHRKKRLAAARYGDASRLVRTRKR